MEIKIFKLLFKTVFKNIKYLGINQKKDRKDPYSENNEILLREIKEELNKWTAIPWSRVRRFNVVKMSILLQTDRSWLAVPIFPSEQKTQDWVYCCPCLPFSTQVTVTEVEPDILSHTGTWGGCWLRPESTWSRYNRNQAFSTRSLASLLPSR